MSRSLRLSWCWFWLADSWSFAESGLNLQEVYETSRGEDFTEAVGAWNRGLGFGWWSLSGRGYAPQRGPEGGLAGGGTLFTEIGADESGVDIDADGRDDLLLSCERGTIRLFMNYGKILEAKTDTGIADRLGWWNELAGADLDGDIDYAVTN